jgi:N-acetylglucosamine kinase-like BadF-type ATPase
VPRQGKENLRPPQELLIALDGGGTKTRCVVFERSGAVRAHLETGPSNHLATQDNQAFETIEQVILDVLKKSHAKQSDVRAVSVGLAGVDLDGEGLLEAEEFLHSLGFQHSIVNADIVTAHAGALGGGPGVLALSGTGTAFYGVTSDGRHVKVGGWGPVYGDEGGAHWIGEMALRAAAAAYDGGFANTELVRSLCDALSLQDFSETLQCIYRSKSQVKLIANLSRTVEATARNGDREALKILKAAGEKLADGVTATLHALGYRDAGCLVAWEGGVLRNSEIVRNHFSSLLQKRFPKISVVAPQFDPVYGAYLIGCKNLEWEIGSHDDVA